MTHSFQNANLIVRAIAYLIDMIIIGSIAVGFLFLSMGKTPRNLIVDDGETKMSLMDKYQFFAYLEPIVKDPQREIYISQFLKIYKAEVFVAILIFPWIFLGLMEGLFGGSIGKLVTGIRVRRKDGGKASIVTTTVRFFAKIGSTLIFFIGFIIAFFDKKKQTLHDKVANTLVLKK